MSWKKYISSGRKTTLMTCFLCYGSQSDHNIEINRSILIKLDKNTLKCVATIAPEWFTKLIALLWWYCRMFFFLFIHILKNTGVYLAIQQYIILPQCFLFVNYYTYIQHVFFQQQHGARPLQLRKLWTFLLLVRQYHSNMALFVRLFRFYYFCNQWY